MNTDWNSFIPKIKELFQKITGNAKSSTEDERLEMLYKKIQSNNYLKIKIEEQAKFDYRNAKTDFLTQNQKRHTGWQWAAILLLPLGITAGIYFSHHSAQSNDIQKNGQTAFPKKQVHLLTSNKKSYNLGTDTLPSNMNIQNNAYNKSLHYNNNATTQGTDTKVKPEIHTLIVPRGCEYSICLPDSTLVWLNADSYLSYPVQFAEDTREVTICGEAYFNVTKQKDKPFIVHTPKGSITVWGTEFNVKAYADEYDFVATLVTGSISCKLPNGKNIRLHPKEQLTCKNNSAPLVEKVDPSSVCSWKDGLFIFKNKRMEDITQQIARWFDIKICYMDEAAKELHFSGDLNKFEDISTFITMFKTCSDLNIWLKNNTLYIQSI